VLIVFAFKKTDSAEQFNLPSKTEIGGKKNYLWVFG